MEHIYQHNAILKYTQGPLYAPLLPFPYGSLEHTRTCSAFASSGRRADADEVTRRWFSASVQTTAGKATARCGRRR